MKKLIFTISFLFLHGCALTGGVAFHAVKEDAPEFNGANPLGFIRGVSDNKLFFCEHISSIPDWEKGLGLNMCGVQVELN